jgi:hypothetical protein
MIHKPKKRQTRQSERREGDVFSFDELMTAQPEAIQEHLRAELLRAQNPSPPKED